MDETAAPGTGMQPRDLLEALLELAARAELEVRMLSASAAAADMSLKQSAACRVGQRIWVVLAPDDPAAEQARVLAGALGRFREEFLDAHFVAPGVRAFIEECGLRPPDR